MPAIVRSAALTLLLMVVVFRPAAVQAHSGGVPILTDEAVGPYHLFVWLQPVPLRAGDVHLDFAVTLPPPPNAPSTALTEPVTDATLHVTFTPVAEPQAATMVVATPNTGLNGFYYEVNVRLDRAGEWRIAVDVAGNAGAGQVEVSREALPARQVNWPLIAGAGTTIVALIGLIGVWNRLQAKE